MLAGELKKWCCNKKIIAVLVAVFFFQIVYFYCGLLGETEEICDYRGYRKISSEISEENQQKILEELDTIMKPENLYRSEGIAVKYTDSTMKEQELYQVVLSELKQIAGYQKYLNDMMDSGNMLSAVFHPSDYSVKDYQAATEVYSQLYDIEMRYGGNYACYLFSKMGLDDIFCIVVFLLIIVSVITLEREKMTILLVRGTPKGRREISLAKYFFGLLISLLFTIFYYGVKLILLSGIYGLGDLSVPVQSIYNMKGAYLPISAGEYLVIFIVLKILSGIMLYSLLYYIAALFRGSLQVYGVSLMVFSLEYVLYALLKKTSSLAWLYDFNVFSFWNAGGVLESYRNINMFGIPIPYPLLWCGILVTGAILFAYMGLRKHSDFRLLEHGDVKRKKERITYKNRRFGFAMLFRGEFVKCWICEKGYYLLLLAVIFTTVFSTSIKEDISSDEKAYYKEYVKAVEGKYSQEKMEYLLAEQERLDNVLLRMSEPGITQDALQVFQDDLKHVQGLEPAISYGKYLEKHSGLSFIYASGYMRMLDGEEGKWNRILRNLIAAFFMSGLSVSVWGIEKWSKMEQLIRISKLGSQKVLLRKAGITFFNGIIVLLVVYVPGIVQLFMEYGCNGIFAPAQSIQQYEMIPKQFNILSVIGMFYLVHLFVIWGIGFLSGIVQKKLNSQIVSTLVSALLSGIMVLLISV